MTGDIRTYDFYKKLTELPFVEHIILFGSRAKGTSRPLSDIDLAVSCPSADIVQWHEVLDTVEHADTLLRIDCVNLNDLKPDSALLADIQTNGIVIYEKAEN